MIAACELNPPFPLRGLYGVSQSEASLKSPETAEDHFEVLSCPKQVGETTMRNGKKRQNQRGKKEQARSCILNQVFGRRDLTLSFDRCRELDSR
jgi:hypothetical protein